MNPTAIDLTLSDLEMSKSISLPSGRLISCKGAELCHISLLNTNRKSNTGSPTASSDLA